MKIKHISGEELDTDKLPDVEAMAIEKVEEFRQFCLDNKIPFTLFVNPKGDNNHYLAFWNFANRENGYSRETVESETKVKVEVRPILRIISNFIYDLSGGQVYLAQKPLDGH
jgi:hypothetical protein